MKIIYLITLIIFLLLLIPLNQYAQIINISDDNSISRQPFFVKHNDSQFVFWIDELENNQNICFKYKINDEWSDLNCINLNGEIDLNSIVSRNNQIYLVYDQYLNNENNLMIGKISESFDFESTEITSYTNFLIYSASLIIDNSNNFHIAWEIYDFNEFLGVYYSMSENLNNWITPELLYEDENQEPPCHPQLIFLSDNSIHSFWLSDIYESTILHTQKEINGNWEPYIPLPFYGFGVNFNVKKDLNETIHIVSNQTQPTTFHNDLYYLFWNNEEWSYPELVPYMAPSSIQNNERWNPDITFLNDGNIYITWNHYAYNMYLEPYDNWIGSAVKLSDSWHENGYFAQSRESHSIKILTDNDQIENIWYDQTDGDYDIYYFLTEPFTEICTNIIQSDVGRCYNYPNPFNPSTNIYFYLLNDSKVNLSVYNLKGQEIRDLINDNLFKGEHSINWNGTDNSGNKVSSGYYFYKLVINEKMKSVKKCLLLK